MLQFPMNFGFEIADFRSQEYRKSKIPNFHQSEIKNPKSKIRAGDLDDLAAEG